MIKTLTRKYNSDSIEESIVGDKPAVVVLPITSTLPDVTDTEVINTDVTNTDVTSINNSSICSGTVLPPLFNIRPANPQTPDCETPFPQVTRDPMIDMIGNKFRELSKEEFDAWYESIFPNPVNKLFSR